MGYPKNTRKTKDWLKKEGQEKEIKENKVNQL